MVDERFTTYDDETKADKGSYTTPDTRIARGEPDRLTDIVNVKDWGATGNGSTDDLAAINAAILYAFTLGRVSHHGAIVFFPPGTYWLSSTLYLDATGGGLISFKGAGRDATILRGNYDAGGAQQEQIPDGFLVRTSGAGSIQDMTIWNESVTPTSGALFSDACGNNRFVENCHFIGMTGYVCASVGFGYRLTDCILTCSKSPTLASDANRSPLYSDAKFFSGYRASGNCTMSGGSVSGFGSISTRDMSNNLINGTQGIDFTPGGLFRVVFYAPGFTNDNTPDGPTFHRAVGHAVAGPDGIIEPADIVLDDPGFGYSYTPIYAVSHSNIYGGVGAYVGEVLVSNCHAYGFDIGFSVIGGATSLKSCSATRCGIGYACAILNGSATFGTLDAEVSPARWYLLFSGDLMSCVADRCTWGIYCYSAKAMFAANRITGATGPCDPAVIASANYTNLGGTVTLVAITTVDDHHLANLTRVQLDPPNLTEDPNGFVDINLTGSKQFEYVRNTVPPSFTTGTWNYPLEYGVTCRNSDGSWFVANTIDVAVTKASFAANGGAEGTSVWSTRGAYGWKLPDRSIDSFSAGLWKFKQCGSGLNRKQGFADERFPANPRLLYFPGQQSNIPGASVPGAEINIVTGQAGLSFEDPLYVFLTLSVTASSGATSLTFASVPPSIVAGMTVDEWFGHIGTPTGMTVTSTDATHVFLSTPTTAAIGAGSRINFLRIGSTTHYKCRYDGVAWRRVG